MVGYENKFVSVNIDVKMFNSPHGPTGLKPTGLASTVINVSFCFEKYAIHGAEERAIVIWLYESCCVSVHSNFVFFFVEPLSLQS